MFCLLDRLKASAHARVINVSSDAHRFARMQWDNLELRRDYEAMKAYAQSKLANILFTRTLAHRLKGTGVTANALHPGFVATEIAHKSVGMIDLFYRIAGRFMRTPEQGAETVVYLATAPDVARTSGEYFIDRRIRSISAAAHDAAAAARLWDVSMQMTTFA